MHRRFVLSFLCAAVVAYAYFHLRTKPSRPSVLIITIDTLRPDHVGRHTPALDAFLGEATRFENARTVAPLTLPAHASLFSGLTPATHAVHDNVGHVVPPPSKRDWPLLAEQFRDGGYATAAFVSRVVLGPRTGIHAGFETYSCPTDQEHHDTGGYVPAEQRVPAAIDWLRDRREPYLCWVHLFDPHAPYRPFPGDARRPACDGYAGEVRRADAAVEQLLAAVPDSTIVVIASDHGEGLREHGEPTHGALCYGSTIDVFLSIRAPGFEGGRIDRQPRNLCDVPSTLRILCGLPEAPDDGAPLQSDGHPVVVAESLMTWRIHGWAQCFSASDGRYTLIESGPRLQLFDRRGDPGETRPLVPEGHPAFERLDRALLAYRAGAAARSAGAELTMALAPYGQLRRVGAAGYIPRTRNLGLRDPEDHLYLWERLEQAHTRLRWAARRADERGVRQALRMIDDLGAAATGSPLLHHYRAKAYVALGELTRDPHWYRRAAHSELNAIRGGFARDQVFAVAVYACVKARDREALRSIRDLAHANGYSSAQLTNATRALHQ